MTISLTCEWWDEEHKCGRQGCLYSNFSRTLNCDPPYSASLSQMMNNSPLIVIVVIIIISCDHSQVELNMENLPIDAWVHTLKFRSLLWLPCDRTAIGSGWKHITDPPAGTCCQGAVQQLISLTMRTQGEMAALPRPSFSVSQFSRSLITRVKKTKIS